MKLVALLLVSLIFSTEASLGKTLMSQLNKVFFFQKDQLGEKSEFGSYIAGLVQLKTSGEIHQFVQSILDSLLLAQSRDDLENASTAAKAEIDISDLEVSVDALSSDQQATNTQVGDLSQDIASLSQTIASSSQQLATLNDRLQDQAEQRTLENGEYQRKGKSVNKMLNAVITVHTKLSSAVLDGEGVELIQSQKNSILKSIKKELGSKHPLAQFIEMSAQFDVETATRVILKLELIKENMQQSLVDQDDIEVHAQTTYNTVSSSLGDVVDRFSADLKQSQSANYNKKNDLIIAQRRSVEISQELSITEDLLLSTRSASVLSSSTYQSQSNARFTNQMHHYNRAEQIRIVSAALDIITSNKETFTESA